MDKLTRYKVLLKEVISEWAEAGQSATDVKTFVSFDDEHENYLMISAGWDRDEHHHNIVFHAHVRDEKIWIEWDGTYPSISEELIQRGMAQEDIVFNWQDPYARILMQGQTTHA